MNAKSLLLTGPLAVSALLSLSLPANAVCWSWKPCADYQGGFGYGCAADGVSVRVAALAARGRSASRVSDRTARCDGSAGSGWGAGKFETEEARSDGEGCGDRRTSSGEAETEAGSSPGASQGNSASGTSSGASQGNSASGAGTG
jgi:hypothetical protein